MVTTIWSALLTGLVPVGRTPKFLFVRLNRKGQQVVSQKLEGLMSRSESMVEAQAEGAKKTRALRRSQSAGAVPRTVKDMSFKQMSKRFSIARERQRSRDKKGDDS